MPKNSVPIRKKLYGKNTYRNVIDTDFSQLIPVETDEGLLSLTVDEFFQAYNTLFYEIPKEGVINSHVYLIEESTKYIGYEQNSEDIDALLEEINSLRKELLETKQTIVNLSTNLNE